MITPDEIMNGLADPVPVHFHGGNPEPHLTPLAYKALEALHADALALIQQLEAQNAELQAERDAAVRDIDLNSRCHACRKFFKNGGECSGGIICISRRFEWRGVQKEDGNA